MRTAQSRKVNNTAAAQLRTLEKTSLIEEIELAAAKEEEQESLNKLDQQELSMRILLILKLEVQVAACHNKSNNSLLRRTSRTTA